MPKSSQFFKVLFLQVFLASNPLFSDEVDDTGHIAAAYPSEDSQDQFDFLAKLVYAHYKAEKKANFFKPLDIDLYTKLVNEGRDQGVIMLVKALKQFAPKAFYYELWVSNPVRIAYDAKKFELMRQVVDANPTLINESERYNETVGWHSSYPVIVSAVFAGDLDTVQYLLDKGANAKQIFRISWGEFGIYAPNDSYKNLNGFQGNLLTISQTAQMDSLLQKFGAPLVNSQPDYDEVKATCNDNKVRMRAEPNTSSKILAVLSKGDDLALVGYTNKFTRVDGKLWRWEQVSVKGTTGWVFGEFVDLLFQPDSP